jgi:hypothetical protein
MEAILKQERVKSRLKIGGILEIPREMYDARFQVKVYVSVLILSVVSAGVNPRAERNGSHPLSRVFTLSYTQIDSMTQHDISRCWYRIVFLQIILNKGFPAQPGI